MGVNSRLKNTRPPLPAPTESVDEASGLDTDVATNVTAQTDKSYYEIPEDGQPLKISTQKVRGSKHSQEKSQTSLLIEYFEGSQKGDKTKARPSVRVKVTPSARKKSGSGGSDTVHITNIGKDRKTSYTRRISLGSSKNVELGVPPPEGTEISLSSDSSNKPPVEVELLDQNGSDLSTRSRGLMRAPYESNVSSMPPESLLDGGNMAESELSPIVDRDEFTPTKDGGYLQEPIKNRDRSASRERIAQRIAEKVRQGSSKSRAIEDDTFSGAESSVLSSNAGARSYRAGSDISNNPKLLGMVEDTIKRIILPEINQIKQDQKTDRNLRSLEGSRRGSILDDVYNRGTSLERRVSKSSSTPNISSRPKVVLNRDGEDAGTVLSRGDSDRKKMRKSSRGSYTEERPSSRRSSGRHSYGEDDYDTVRAKSSRSSSKLTADALKTHDSQTDMRDGRKRRSKSRGSRSRSAGLATEDDGYGMKELIPPLPMASNINESEMTRESIVSDLTETPKSAGTHTPIHEVSRGSLREATSPASSRTPNRTPVSRGLGMSHTNKSIESPKSPYGGQSTKGRVAALAAAALGGAAVAKGLGDAYDRHVDADGYGSSPPPVNQRKISSPVQSVSSLKKNFEEDTLSSKELRPRSAASRSSTGKRASQTSLPGQASSPSTKLARSRQQSRDAGTFGTPDAAYAREGTPGTPTYGESVDDWYARQSLVNDQYRNSGDYEGNNRDSFAAATNRDSYQTNPYPQDEKRFTFFSEDGEASPALDAEQGVRGVGANPEYVHTRHGAESAVASLIIDPSNISGSDKPSPQTSPTKASYKQRMDAHLRDMGKDSPAMYEGSTLSQTMPSQDRWAAIKGHARNISGSNSRDDVRELRSPQQSPAKSFEDRPVMVASSLPVADDPLPEIGHFDDSKSDVTTNPSIIQGPLGGDAAGRDPWPYTSQPQADAQRELSARNTPSVKSGHGKEAGLVAAAAAGGAVLAAAAAKRQPTVEDEYDEAGKLTPDVGRRGDYIDREATPTSLAAFRDEGYMTDAQARSAGALTPRADQQRYSKREIDEFNRAMDAYDGPEDPFTGPNQHARNVGGNSDGMDSPIYDRAAGKGSGNIESKDVVALMDHLTVRDAQRNARDTEILVTLVRTAAEMRQSFDEMKKFIADQDAKIMQNAERSNDQTVRKVLGGPRPLPTGSPRTENTSKEDVQTRRKGMLRRALKGLTSSKSSNDLAKVESMLMQILDNVEDLKHQGGAPTRDIAGSYATDTRDTLDSYERLRNAPDSGYEPEGQAGTSSTPSHSGNLSLTPRAEKQQFHSGYDGRRGSVNRVSTVLEGDEDDDLEPHENLVLNHQFENNERLLTPTQEVNRQRGLSPSGTPPHQAASYNGAQGNDLTPRSTEKQRKHKSNNSSVFGVPKVSRWSKTTASSAAPDPSTLDSPVGMGYGNAGSESSRSGAEIARFDDEPYELQDEDRLRSTQSLAREQEARSVRSQVSKLTRTPSPLIPSEASAKDRDMDRDVYVGDRMESPIQEDLDDGFDDPKYHAHRNSLLLQHPQPRQGPTGRHQNTLESQAHDFTHDSRTNSDLSIRTTSDFDPATWGSSGTAGIAKHRLSQLEPLSPISMSSPAAYGSNRNSRDDGPLIPQKQQQQAQPPPKPSKYAEPDYDDYEPQYSASGFSRGAGYYNSPWGSGHLLEPIEEVRYSLETDSGHLSPEPQVVSAKAVDMRSPARKITGPRPMNVKGEQPRLVETSGTVRRKPVGGSRESFEDETF